jgi:hypothetical protein
VTASLNHGFETMPGKILTPFIYFSLCSCSQDRENIYQPEWPLEFKYKNLRIIYPSPSKSSAIRMRSEKAALREVVHRRRKFIVNYFLMTIHKYF